MTPTRRGRPRAQRSRTGLGTEEDVLAAAGALFCEVGYGSTSTYAIAERAGVSQASMYHYFAGKQAVLLALLLRTVKPSLEASERLLAATATDEARLWQLCRVDAGLLASGRDNLGSLYLLPELSADPDSFAVFHDTRSRLRGTYDALAGRVARAAGTVDEVDTGLVFDLVESVVLRRRAEHGIDPGRTGLAVADAALRLLGVGGARLAAARVEGATLGLVEEPDARPG